MAAPSFVEALAGETDAGGNWSFGGLAGWPSGLNNGDIVIAQILQDGTTNAALGGFTGGNIKPLAGGADGWTQIPGPLANGSWAVGSSEEALQFLFIGRSTGLGATGTTTIAGTNSTSEDLYCRLYRFANVSTGTTLATVIENATAGNATNDVGTSNTASDTAVQTLGPDRLALNFVGVNDDNAISNFTGMSGGTWSQPVSPYADAGGTDGAIGICNATMATAGTIDGGTGSIVDIDAWGVVGFALIGTTPDVVTYIPRFNHVDHANPGVL